MENLTDYNSDFAKLELNNNAIKQLSLTRKWALFLSIIGFVFIGLIILTVVIAFSLSGNDNPSSGLQFLPLLVISTVYFFPIYFLFQFSSYSKKAVKNNDSIQFSKALKYLKNHYQFMGILIIILTGFYLLLGATMLTSSEFLNSF